MRAQYPSEGEEAAIVSEDGGGVGLRDCGSHVDESKALRMEDATASICLSAASKAPALKLRTSLEMPPSWMGCQYRDVSARARSVGRCERTMSRKCWSSEVIVDARHDPAGERIYYCIKDVRDFVQISQKREHGYLTML